MAPAKKGGKKEAAEPPVAQAQPREAEADQEGPLERIVMGANEWEAAKIIVKPREQVKDLSEKQLSEEFTKIWRADNPGAAKNIIRFSHKDKAFKMDPSVDQLEVHFAQEGVLLNISSDEAKKQREREEDEKNAAAKEAEKKKAEGGEGDEDASNLRNQFNFSERASQTLNNALRERGTITEPPPSVEYSSQCTQVGAPR